MAVCARSGCFKLAFVEHRTKISHKYCGRTHAMETEGSVPAPHGDCHSCNLSGCTSTVAFDSISGRVHDFCSEEHAEIAIRNGDWAPPQRKTKSKGKYDPLERHCDLHGCSLPVFDDGSGKVFDYCGRSHAVKHRLQQIGRTGGSSSSSVSSGGSSSSVSSGGSGSGSGGTTTNKTSSSDYLIQKLTASGNQSSSQAHSNVLNSRQPAAQGNPMPLTSPMSAQQFDAYQKERARAAGLQGLQTGARTPQSPVQPGPGGGPSSASDTEPPIVSGYQYHGYSNGTAGDSSRYVYTGKDDDGTPQFLDYGRKGGASVSAATLALPPAPAPAPAPASAVSASSAPARAYCVVCLENTACIVLIPCGHICLCEEHLAHMEATSVLNKCPCCTQTVQSSHKVFYNH